MRNDIVFLNCLENVDIWFQKDKVAAGNINWNRVSCF